MNNCCGHNNHNCLDELSSDHKKILESLAHLESSIGENELDKEQIKRFLDFTKNFSEPHHKKEEDVLFPALEKKGMPNEGGPIGMMLFEHNTKRDYIKKMEKGLEENDAASIKTNSQAVISLMREHIFKEDNILYPCAKDFLSDEELSDLAEKCSKILL